MNPLDKPFVTAGTVLQVVNTNRSQLRNLFPYIPHLYITARGMHLFPTGYILAYQWFLAGQPPTLGNIQSFNQTVLAQTRYQVVAERLECVLASQEYLSAQAVAATFGVSRSTLTGWIQGDPPVFQAIHVLRGAQKVVPPGENDRYEVWIPVDQIRQAISWVVPGAH